MSRWTFASAFAALLVAVLLPKALLAAVENDSSGTPTIKCVNGPGACSDSNGPDSDSSTVEYVPSDGEKGAVAGLYGTNSGGIAVAYRSNSYKGRFSNSIFESISVTPTNGSSKNGCDKAGDPIEISYGAKIESQTLFALPGEMGLRYELFYRSVRPYSQAPYETNTFSYALDLNCDDQGDGRCRHVIYSRPDGSSIKFGGNPANYGGFPEIGGGGLATLTHNADGTWVLHDEDAKTITWTENTQTGDAYLNSIKDASGIGWTFSTVSSSPFITRVTHTNGQTITIEQTGPYGSGSSMTFDVSVTDPSGNVYSLVTDVTGKPLSVTLPGSPQTVITYKYDGVRLTEVDYNGTPYSITTYDSSGRATGTHLADGSQDTSILYSFSADGGMTATITNSLGHSTVNTYTMATDASGYAYKQLASISDDAVSDCGATIHSRGYDTNGNLTRTVDNNGVTHTYSYATNGQLQSETGAYGTTLARKTDYAWDSNQQLNRLLSVTVEGESKTSYSYNAQNRLASVTRADLTAVGGVNSLTTTYTYTLYGNGMVQSMMAAVPSPNGTDKVTTHYDTLGNVTSVADGLGHITTYTGYNGLGEPGHVTGPNGDVTDYMYDARGRVVTKTTHPNGTAATWSYTYDGFGLLASVTAPGNDITTWTRDAEMRVTSIAHNDKDGTATESFTYDANGDVTSDVIKRGSDIGKSSTFVYDGLGRIYQRKGTHGQVLTYAYDGNGNVLSVTDALGHKTSYQYDALDRVTKMVDANGGTTQYAYDAGDHLTKVTDPRGLVTTYSYDGLGLLWSQTSPDTGTTLFSYDGYARLATKTRADGVQETYSYDTLNRPTQIAADGQTQTFTYDNCTNGQGRLCTVAQTPDTVSYSYTPQGQIAQRQFSFNDAGALTYSLGYSYDAAGRLATVNYPDGNQALYYYTNGAVSKVDFQVGNYLVIGVSGITYRPMDTAMSGWKSYNGLVNTIQYDSDLRPTSISVPGVQNLSFTYDVADRITKITNGMDASMTQSLGYDALNRLTGVSSGAESESYFYDTDGNRLSQTVNGVATSYQIDAASNRLLSRSSNGATVGYSYDPRGNMLSYGNGTQPQMFFYNGFDRLSDTVLNGSTTHFRVGPEGQRLRKDENGFIFWYAPDVSGKLLAENYNGYWRDYVWLNGRLITVIANGGVFSLHDDQTGRPQVMTEPNGTNIDWAAQNKPFDRSVTTNAWGPFNIGFPGQYYDSEDDLWYNNARDYDATLGRYIESDPTGLLGGINPYVYAADNPITLFDPLGLAYQVAENYSFTVITPWVGVAVSVSAGISFDGWNTRTFSQGQLSTGVDSAGFFVGLGSGYSFGHGENPTTGLSSAPYIEADIDALLGLGGSATKDACGNVNWSLSKGFKGSIGVGVGAFSGTAYSATGASPTLGSIFGH